MLFETKDIAKIACVLKDEIKFFSTYSSHLMCCIQLNRIKNNP